MTTTPKQWGWFRQWLILKLIGNGSAAVNIDVTGINMAVPFVIENVAYGETLDEAAAARAVLENK